MSVPNSEPTSRFDFYNLVHVNVDIQSERSPNVMHVNVDTCRICDFPWRKFARKVHLLVKESLKWIVKTRMDDTLIKPHNSPKTLLHSGISEVLPGPQLSEHVFGVHSFSVKQSFLSGVQLVLGPRAETSDYTHARRRFFRTEWRNLPP